ncbi:hypothetical protein SAMD00023378_1815 [Ralstonia sp. NT80]|nr:hypothetical protein SAMD00023378_1815 [Ralstonia sp. NT80]
MLLTGLFNGISLSARNAIALSWAPACAAHKPHVQRRHNPIVPIDRRFSRMTPPQGDQTPDRWLTAG